MGLQYDWSSVMLIRVLVLKDSLRTYFKSLFLSLSWSLGVRSLSWSFWSIPCPYPGPCGLVLVLVLVFSPCKDLVPLFHYSHIIVVSMHTISLIILTYVFPAVILLCVYSLNMMSMVLPCSSVKIIDIIRLNNGYGYNTSLVFHIESSNENLK